MTSSLARDGIPAAEQLLPNLMSQTSVKDGQIVPAPATVPSPMGVADYGIQEVGGVNVPTLNFYQSIAGRFTMNEIGLNYPNSAGPDEFSLQLNTVASNVTLFGNSSYQFWTQNVVYYFQSTHSLHLLDAIVNFTNSDFNFSPNTIIEGNGFYYPGFGYFYPYGPDLTVPEPFTINFYNNLTVQDGDSAIYFNYSVSSPDGIQSGSFDLVVFNSQPLSGPAITSVSPLFEINGYQLTGTGFIPYDAEMILGGDGGGSTASIFDINAEVQLFLEAAGASSYSPIPAGYSFGSETGETVSGVAEWASGGPDPVVHLGPGPANLGPLFGVLGAPPTGYVTQTLNVQPTNAFIFGSLGSTFNANTAAWGPVPTSGRATYLLPPGTYSYDVMLSDHDPVLVTISGSGSAVIRLRTDWSQGVYTPLWAFDNAQLAAISLPGGSGSQRNPYLLDNNGVAQLDPLFSTFNDYIFWQFPGVFLSGTTAYVALYQAPSFTAPLSLSWEVAYSYSAYLPPTTQLTIYLYATDHASVVDCSDIGGWWFVSDVGESEANLVLWNATDTLVAGNTFQDSSISMFTFGGAGNVLWGNVFETYLDPAAPYPGFILNYGIPQALQEWESGDLIYNNAFDTPQTAVSPPYSIYSFYGVPETWTDSWDVIPQPAFLLSYVNGWRLTGSILGLPYVAGNFWSNYGSGADPYGELPYNDSGAIAYGGDYFPVVPYPLYDIVFIEHGLPHGTEWSVTMNGFTQSTTGRTLVFEDPTGSYPFAVATTSSYTPTPASGVVVLTSHSVVVVVYWS
ncbi:MAG TPA: thermopsin family protease [Thermoplasmata archaeon]|nr:thermopsin family protease [Thermoplasmata archaeon]